MTDEFDDELRDALRARSGGAVGTTSAREAVLGRAATIRRRRAVAAGSGALVVLALGALVLVPRDRDDRIAPADDVTVPSVDTTDADEDAGAALPTTTVDADDTADDVPTTAIDSTSATTAPTSTTAPRATMLGGAATSESPAAVPTTDTGATPPPTVSPTATTTATTATTTTTTATTVAPTTTAAPTTAASPTTTAADPAGTPPFTTTYQSSGGSITVDWNGTSLSLLSVQPAAGYAAEIEDQTSSRIRVRFRGDDDARIEVRADNGQVEEIIS